MEDHKYICGWVHYLRDIRKHDLNPAPSESEVSDQLTGMTLLDLD